MEEISQARMVGFAHAMENRGLYRTTGERWEESHGWTLGHLIHPPPPPPPSFSPVHWKLARRAACRALLGAGDDLNVTASDTSPGLTEI
jgi:hypothetical protein